MKARRWRSWLSCVLQQSTKTAAETQLGLHVKPAPLSQGEPKWIPDNFETAPGSWRSVLGAFSLPGPVCRVARQGCQRYTWSIRDIWRNDLRDPTWCMWVARSYLSFASSHYVLYLESTIAFLILKIRLRIRETECETLTSIYAASKSRFAPRKANRASGALCLHPGESTSCSC
jgi:hypothetical protein